VKAVKVASALGSLVDGSAFPCVQVWGRSRFGGEEGEW
jgi:hypothetical protein